MALHPLFGHLEQRTLLAQAGSSNRLPQVLLFTGPAGVGKQRLALWTAQILLCEAPGPEPCATCRACRQVVGLVHPDLHWFMPVARPKAADPDKQVEELADTLAETIAERREDPLYGPADGMAAHFVATARLLQRRAALTPVEARKKVFIIAEADRLVPQEANPEAANAMLKLLEEPPADTHFILTSVEWHSLLPTIRSRSIPFRLGRLKDEEVRRFLATQVEPPLSPSELDRRVARARGSIGAAIAEDQGASKARAAAADLLQAVLAGTAPRLERALKQGAWAARGDFTAMLDALSDTLAQAARHSTEPAEARTVRRPAAPEGILADRPLERLVEASRRVAAARDTAQGNVNPQLILAVLGEELAEVL